MRYVALVTLALVFGATIAIDPRVTALVEKCQSTSFGKTLYGTLELELSSGQPGQYLVNLLDGMVNTVKNDITRADNNHNEFQASCTQDINSLQQEVRNHANNVRESNDIISKANQRLAWDKVELENNQRQLAESQESIEKSHRIRNEEAQVFTQKTNELNEALSVLHTGRQLIENNLARQGALVQVGSGFTAYVRQMTDKIRHKPYRGRGFVSLISILADLAANPNAQANQETVQKIISLIQGVIDEIEKAKNTEYQAEQERINNYNEIVELLTKRINELESNINRLTNEINNLTQIITQNKNRVTDNTRQIQIKKRQQIKRKKECTAENNQYAKENAVRQENFNLLSEALTVIQQNIEEFRNIVLKNSEAGIASNYQQ